MNIRDLRPRRLLILVGVAVVLIGQAGSAVYQRYLRCQSKVLELITSESSYRSKAGSLEKVATNLRAVASLAREMAGSSSSEYERKKWLDMALTRERKADKADVEAAQLMTRADQFASQADEFATLAWRPWLAGPE